MTLGVAAFARANFSRAIALVVLVIAAGTITGAWTLESMGYIPCELCLLGRIPYYVGIILAALTVFAAQRGGAGLARLGLALLALAFFTTRTMPRRMRNRLSERSCSSQRMSPSLKRTSWA